MGLYIKYVLRSDDCASCCNILHVLLPDSSITATTLSRMSKDSASGAYHTQVIRKASG